MSVSVSERSQASDLFLFLCFQNCQIEIASFPSKIHFLSINVDFLERSSLFSPTQFSTGDLKSKARFLHLDLPSADTLQR